MIMKSKTTFGGGCFWCTEAIFLEVSGITSVVSGYAGGESPDPTYQQVLTGNTGHAEVVQIEFDQSSISFKEILDIFWSTHDPTTLNRQGNDIGAQYRSILLAHDDFQYQTAHQRKDELNTMKLWSGEIVTEIRFLDRFYPAEDYHQNYFARNPGNGYCSYVISPKLNKFRTEFSHLLKK